MIGAVELGLLYAVMAVGVYLTFRVLDFPDLTVDGSFTTDSGQTLPVSRRKSREFSLSLKTYIEGEIHV